MHNSYFFLQPLSAELNQQLQGFSIVSCFSQSKDELIIELNNRTKSFLIKAHLQAEFCCLSFPSSYARARKNSVDLFQEVVLKEVLHVRSFENERSFAFELSGGLTLLFKMHGNRANVVLFQQGSVIGIFRNHLKADLALKLNSMDRHLDWTFAYFQLHQADLKVGFFTLSNEAWGYLANQSLDALAPDQKWGLLHTFHNQLTQGEFYIVKKDDRIFLSLFPFGEVQKKYNQAISAINDFFYLKMQTGAIGNDRLHALKTIHEKEKQSLRYLDKNKALLQSLESEHPYQLWADLIMANLHLIKGIKDEKITLDNYKNAGQSIDIKLKKGLPPQKTAEVYYHKAKNQKVEIENLTESIRQKELTLVQLQDLKSQVDKSQDSITVKQLMKGASTITTSQKETIRLPYREIEFYGFIIRIGKSAADNDELTLKYAHKEDLWLHAKDVSGSHVVVKHQSKKNFPKEVIERAAELAAFNSKRKGESLCPVSITSKKFVRKRKGDPAGLVVVEKEKVIMVQPKG